MVEVTIKGKTITAQDPIYCPECRGVHTFKIDEILTDITPLVWIRYRCKQCRATALNFLGEVK